MCIFCSNFHLLWKVGVSHFHVAYVYHMSTSGWSKEHYTLHTWAILVGYMIKAKLWLILKTITKGRAKNSLQCGLASKQLFEATIQNIDTQSWYALESNKICNYYGRINGWHLFHVAYLNLSSNVLQPFISIINKFSSTMGKMGEFIHYGSFAIFFIPWYLRNNISLISWNYNTLHYLNSVTYCVGPIFILKPLQVFWYHHSERPH